ncbi:hypothetical protein GJ744_001721 [Endocarpon pusillum]|uniref:Uncharacterized protein n=1 Tax=Endocarpon pusillum TaxID=364733 RepID=A0A8H7A9R4_9EURO|nr:hypothetical protein GJ744_001721 [Endocarpon pusillum]
MSCNNKAIFVDVGRPDRDWCLYRLFAVFPKRVIGLRKWPVKLSIRFHILKKLGKGESFRRKLADPAFSEAEEQDSVEAQMDDGKSLLPETRICLGTFLFGSQTEYG